MENSLERLGRREWWLWLSALAVTALSGIAFLLSAFPSLFQHPDHFYEIRSDQAKWGTLSLLLLFNAWLVYRQWLFRKLRKEFAASVEGPAFTLADAFDPSRMDPVTGLHTRASVDHWLGKEVARARRRNLPLSVVALHLDEFAQLSERFGDTETDALLKEFSGHLRKASRGSDLLVRLAPDDFLLVLSECSLNDAKIVSDRLVDMELKCGGQNVVLTYSIGWIDYKPGEVPSDLIKRAQEVLQLYKKASSASSSPTLIVQ
jgi:diguanylate cyclase (GGDEF)-like protein